MDPELFNFIYRNRISHLRLQIAKHTRSGNYADAKLLKGQLYQMEKSLYSGKFLAIRFIEAQ